MNRNHFQALAKERLRDAKALLGRRRWSGAYYLTGYVVECGLKSCVLKHLHDTGALFSDARYLKDLAGCWTHDLETLVRLAGLVEQFGIAQGANPNLAANWATTKAWKESSRYHVAAELAARELYDAVSHQPDGVLLWIQSHW